VTKNLQRALLLASLLSMFSLAVFATAAMAQSVAPPIESVGPPIESVTPPPIAPEAPRWTGPQVTVKTTMGDFVITLDTIGAPKTAAQFLRLVRAGHYNGARWFRIEPGFLIQIGDEDATGKYRPPPVYPRLPLETATNKHEKYAVAMANAEPKTPGRSSWYVDLAENSGLNAKEGAPLNTTGFAVFGHVTAGVDVVDKIGAVERLPKGGPFPGKLPKTPVIVKSAVVTKAK
jgi:cyclophilin family peptidyl-prolyl cis-trans isomerase